MDSVPVIPISGWMGDNLLKKSENMGWWSGVDVKSSNGSTVKDATLLNALNEFSQPPTRVVDAP
eukprot:CAMPEP_0113692852 /NCGR_PEP_ID=MMETSP0038_2-20120614/19329_1 /TAXON_ID=2898 /ORGANISM="Cryptomonas paramecium" /LENGTH=63 /DNA_ID=CAMNT_0000614839 /DNA_START=9 /DNA_END=196 /DNA_ORIENTATION=- /assembly_acc=CAM_ASM_000170